MKKKYFILISLLLFSTAAFCQQYSEEYLDSLIQIKAQAEVAKSSKFVITGYTSLTSQFYKDQSSFSGVGLTPILLWKP
jgi:hypothetical protein